LGTHPDRHEASEPRSTNESQDFALTSVLQKIGVQESDVDEIKVVGDVESYEKVMMQKCDEVIEEPGKAGWFVRELHNESDPVEFGSVGEATLLDLDDAYELKQKYPKFNFDFQKGEK